jgi:hypothetical protein
MLPARQGRSGLQVTEILKSVYGIPKCTELVLTTFHCFFFQTKLNAFRIRDGALSVATG